MDTISSARDIETVVIGAGQAGLSAGYHLAERGREFVILDAYERVGDNWRCHWDSLRLYSPALAASLPGMKFPASRTSYPTKDEMADFLEAYRAAFELPVRGGVRVSGVRGDGDRYLVTCTDGSSYGCDNVVVATGTFGRKSERAGLRRRAGPGDPSAALERLQAPVAAATGPGAGGRGVALGRRHRLRGGLGRPPGGAQRTHPRAGSVPPRLEARQGRLPRAVLPGPARAHPPHPGRAQDPPGGPGARRPADPGEEGRPRPRRCRHDARPHRRGEGRPAGAGRRPDAGRDQRRVVHRLPAGLLLDRSCRSPATTAGRWSAGEWWGRHPACTSSGSRSSSRSRRCSSAAPAATPSTS